MLARRAFVAPAVIASDFRHDELRVRGGHLDEEPGRSRAAESRGHGAVMADGDIAVLVLDEIETQRGSHASSLRLWRVA